MHLFTIAMPTYCAVFNAYLINYYRVLFHREYVNRNLQSTVIRFYSIMFKKYYSYQFHLAKNQKKKIQIFIFEKKRKTALRVINTYRTVSRKVVLVIAGMSHITLLAAKRGSINKARVSRLEELEGNTNPIGEQMTKK